MKWAHQLKAVTDGLISARIAIASELEEPAQFGQVVFVDAGMERVEKALERIERKGRAVFLLVEEQSARARKQLVQLASWIGDGKVDDVLVAPLRPLEVLSKLRHYHQLMMWDEVSNLNASVSDLIGRLQDDLKLAERLQKSKMPVRFPEVKGFKVSHRYLAGMKSGGDYFDLADATQSNQLSMVMTDSSSYGLSSSVLSVLMRVVMKLSSDDARSCEETFRRIHSEILLTLGEKDRLSLFYGVISRKDYRLRYVNRGTSCAFYADPGAGFRLLPAQGEPITQATPVSQSPADQAEVELKPEGRLVLVSDGFIEAAGGAPALLKKLDAFGAAESADLLNELVFSVKSKFTEPDDMPAQDCTAVLFDVDARILRKV